MKFLVSLLAIQTAAALAADAPAPKKDTELPPCCRPALPAGKPTDRSLYQLDSTWTSDVGRKVKLSVLRGQFAHTNMITLLNAEGEIAFQQAGLGQGPAALAAEIVKLTAPKKP